MAFALLTRSVLSLVLLAGAAPVTAAQASNVHAPTIEAADSTRRFRIPEVSDAELQQFEPSVRQQFGAALERAKRHPTVETIGGLGLLLHAYDQYDRAAACYTRAAQLEPDAFRWRYYLGLAEADAGRADRAIVRLREALRVDSTYLPARLRLAELLFQQGSIAESHHRYAAAVADHPSSAMAQYGLARTLAERGETAAALASYQRAVQRSPRFAAAHYALALLHRTLGQQDRVEEHFTRYRASQGEGPPREDPLLEAIEANRVGPYHHLARGRHLQAGGRHQEAIDAFERALRLDATLVQAHVNLIASQGAVGAFDQAHAHYRRALAIQPDLPEAHYNYGVLLMAQERGGDAIAAFRGVLTKDPSHVGARNNLAYLLAREGQHKEAKDHLRAALAVDPAHRDAHFNLARSLQATGDEAEALDHFRAATKIEDEKTPLYLYYLAVACAQQGNVVEAKGHARDARRRATSLGLVELVRRVEREFGLPAPESRR